MFCVAYSVYVLYVALLCMTCVVVIPVVLHGIHAGYVAHATVFDPGYTNVWAKALET